MHNQDVRRGYTCCYCCLPSPPVLLHIYCTCVSTFWHCHSYALQNFNRNFFTPVSLILVYIYLLAYRNALCVCASPTPFAVMKEYE